MGGQEFCRKRAACGLLVMLWAGGLWAGHAQGAAFALREHSASAQGHAFAGASAAAEDISFMVFNPAGLTRQSGRESLVVLSAMAPRVRYSARQATTVLGAGIDGGQGGPDAAPDVLVPSLFLATDLDSSRLSGLRFGLALYVPFGLGTSYAQGWQGRYHALDSEIVTYNLNPVLAWQASPRWSFGAGVQLSYSRARLSSANDFGTIDVNQFGNAFGGTPLQDDGVSESVGDGLAAGVNFGILHEWQPGSRIGLAYRSDMPTVLKGQARFVNSAVGNAMATSTGAFVDTGVRTRMHLPESISMGLYHELSPEWAVLGEVAWTRWSRIKELRLRFDNPNQSDSVIPAQWKDSWFLAAGVKWSPSPRVTWRFGVAWDQSPVPDTTRTPRVPDGDRSWISAGLTWRLTDHTDLSAALTRIHVKKSPINLSTSESSNTYRGNLRGEISGRSDILSLHLVSSF